MFTYQCVGYLWVSFAPSQPTNSLPVRSLQRQRVFPDTLYLVTPQHDAILTNVAILLKSKGRKTVCRSHGAGPYCRSPTQTSRAFPLDCIDYLLRREIVTRNFFSETSLIHASEINKSFIFFSFSLQMVNPHRTSSKVRSRAVRSSDETNQTRDRFDVTLGTDVLFYNPSSETLLALPGTARVFPLCLGVR